MTHEIGAKKIIGYCDRLSVEAGDNVQFKVSCYESGHYRADLVHVICGDKTQGGGGFEEKVLEASFAGEYLVREQKIDSGSYGYVDLQHSLNGKVIGVGTSFTLQVMVYATTVRKGLQGLLGTWSNETKKGVSLVIADDGSAGLMFSNKSGTPQLLGTGVPIPERHWTLVSASYDAETHVLVLRQQPKRSTPTANFVLRPAQKEFLIQDEIVSSGEGLFLFAGLLEAQEKRASGWRVTVDESFNGKLDRPRWSLKDLSERDIFRLNETVVPEALPEHVAGCWDFSREISSTRLIDIGSMCLHGWTVNLPARGVTGFNWDGTVHDWKQAPEQYGAIHFHDDDVYDAGWETDFCYTVPSDLRSGIYAARLRLGVHEDRIVFFVRAGVGQSKAPIAFLIPTASYMAYGNSLSGQTMRYEATHDPRYQGEIYKTLKQYPEYGLSLYDCHSDGSGVQYSSRLRPIVDMKLGTDNVWQLTADTLITAWLSRRGYIFDVVTDEDLDQHEVEALQNYRVVITGTHPEYYSERMRQGLDGYLADGGRLIYMGGNGLYCRVAYHDELPGVIELRRGQKFGPQWGDEPGQYYHSFTGEYGGLFRHAHNPEYASIGVGTSGIAEISCLHYQRTKDIDKTCAAFIVEGVKGDITNDFGATYGALLCDEFDSCDLNQGTPPHVIIIASAKPQNASYTFSFGSEISADMVFFECPNGGAVFSASSLSWGYGLAAKGYDNDVARISGNVLNRFLDPTPFDVKIRSRS